MQKQEQAYKSAAQPNSETSSPEIWSPLSVNEVALQVGNQICKDFVVDDHLKKPWRALVLYFANDPRFESEGHGSLSKGILLTGEIGTGKTMLMRIFANNPRQNYVVIPCSRIAGEYELDGPHALEYYSMGSDFYNGRRSFCFDDLGDENTSVNYMGTKTNVMQRIISSRYDRKIRFNQTHFTTNLFSSSGISTMYGPRILSRLKEMVNQIIIPGTDRRK